MHVGTRPEWKVMYYSCPGSFVGAWVARKPLEASVSCSEEPGPAPTHSPSCGGLPRKSTTACWYSRLHSDGSSTKGRTTPTSASGPRLGGLGGRAGAGYPCRGVHAVLNYRPRELTWKHFRGMTKDSQDRQRGECRNEAPSKEGGGFFNRSHVGAC